MISSEEMLEELMREYSDILLRLKVESADYYTPEQFLKDWENNKKRVDNNSQK